MKDETDKLDEFDGHPVVSTVHQQFEEPWRQRKKVMGSPRTELTDNVDDGCRHTRVFLGIH